DAPLRTRRERAEYLRKQNPDFFDRYGPQAREVLEALLSKYREHGPTQFNLAEVVDVPPISNFGNLIEIAGRFGGPREMKNAVDQMQSLLYHS
ncbi:type I restriction-modification enzyme R subunit C-terminal domain-containing protein, partial [Vibrio parahaemolyticus]